MAKEIDCLGEFCPVPLVKAQQEYKKMESGDEAVITSDLSCATSNIKNAFKNKKCKIESNEVMTGIWKITIKKL